MSHNVWHELAHLGAAVALVVGGLFFFLMAARRRREPMRAFRPETVPPPSRTVAAFITLIAAALSAAAGVIHLAAAPAHFAEGLGWGFVGAAVAQLAWALVYALRPSPRTALVGVIGSVAILAAWAWSRTIGLPIGPHAGVAEMIGVPDAASTLFEVLLVALLVGRRVGVERPLTGLVARAPSLPAIAFVPTVGVVFIATILAATVALGETHAADDQHGPSHADVAGPAHSDTVPHPSGERRSPDAHRIERAPADATSPAATDSDIAAPRTIPERPPTVVREPADDPHASAKPHVDDPDADDPHASAKPHGH